MVTLRNKHNTFTIDRLGSFGALDVISRYFDVKCQYWQVRPSHLPDLVEVVSESNIVEMSTEMLILSRTSQKNSGIYLSKKQFNHRTIDVIVVCSISELV